MKTKIFSMMALAAMLLGTSCSNDELNEPANGQPMTANFSVELPTGISARKVANGAKKAFADGKTATKLKYMVFDNEGKLIEGLGGEKDINLTATVQLQLTTGKEYKIVFWAANANAPYTLDDNGVVTVDYSNIKANDESLDAFYRCYDYKAGADVENPIKLYRPFAQLNVGTNDMEAAAKTGFNKAAAQTEVKVSGIANQLNLLTGAVSGDAEVTYKLNAIPQGETFPKAGYDYLSMDYLLVGKEAKSNVDVKWQITDGANTVNRTFANVPVQGNYRTNIYGALLTSTTDFNVQIEPAFQGEHNYEVKDASELSAAIAADGDANITLTSNVAGVKGLDILAGKKVSIDLGGYTLTVDGYLDAYGDLTINNGTVKSLKESSAPLYVDANGKLTMNNVNLDAPKASGILLWDAGNATVTLTKCNINVRDFGVTTNAKTGFTGAKVTIDGCEINAATGIMFNVPSTINVKNSKVTGWWQAMMLRGGTANIEGSHLILAFNEELAKKLKYANSTKEASEMYLDGNWESGNSVPVAALTLGTNNGSAYQYPTVLNMSNTEVVGKSPFRAVFQSNSGVKNTVTYNDKGGNTITGEWLKWAKTN